MKKFSKSESSIPIQSRVPLTTLAELAAFWYSKTDRPLTMSLLVSSSLELLRDILNAEDHLPASIESVADAHDLLSALNLYQRKMYSRGKKKLIKAMSFENMRKEGVDPETYVPQEFKLLHNKNSVKEPIKLDIGQSDLAKEVFKKMEKEQSKKDKEKLDEIKRM